MVLNSIPMDAASWKAFMAPEVIRASNEGIGITIGAAVAFVGVLLLIGLFMTICSTSKTKEYRRTITDMYVAGSIRKFAKEDNISLDEEYKVFQKWERKGKNEMRNLDSVVESNLKEKLSEKNDKAIEELSGEGTYLDLSKK